MSSNFKLSFPRNNELKINRKNILLLIFFNYLIFVNC